MTAPSRPPLPLDPPAGGAAVRMYRSAGLGDCFLLAFRPVAGSGDDRVRHVLIDCGVFFRTPGEEERMLRIARDVEATVGKPGLDVLVVTHEHWDHTSGFRWAKEVFDRLPIEEVWLAWTEDPAHPLGRRLREARRESLALLARAVERLDRAAAAAEALGPGARGEHREAREARRIEEVAHFFGPLPAAGARGPAAAGEAAGGAEDDGDLGTTAAQMGYVRRLGRRRRFHRPGGVIADTLPGVRVFVLGPPEDEELLLRSHPRKGEVYEKDDPGLSPAAALAAGLVAELPAAALSLDERLLRDRLRPFGEPFPIPLAEAATHPRYGGFFRRCYGFGDGRAGGQGGGPAWRRVDDAWLGAAGELALALDGDTNNTSLALAFELPGGRVLLFPGDAQAGNWVSWHRHTWRPDGAGGATVGAADLLARTVLYKVGHHASHNATLRADGLERMTHPDLCALVPVDAEQARRKRWAMPFPPLHARLRERTGGRVLRADVGLEEPAAGGPGGAAADEAFRRRVRSDPDGLWIEVSIPGGPA